MQPSTLPSTWESLQPFDAEIAANDQVALIAGTGGGKSTLWATFTLPVRYLVAIDDKGSLTLPASRIVELPQFDPDRVDLYDTAIERALRVKPDDKTRAANRLILRLHVLDNENFEAHDRIYRWIYLRNMPCIVVIDEITATGATPARCQPWLRAISSRGRTRGIGLWSCSQAPFGLFPRILVRNAEYVVIGPIEPDDAAEIRRPGIEIALSIPTKTGRFVVYQKGERGYPRRLYLPIPPILKGWKAP